MIFGNPMTIIQVSEELNGVPVFLYEALNKAEIRYGGKPLKFSQFIPAPLVTNAEIEMIGGQLAKLSLTFEASASSIMKLRSFFNPLAKVSYKWFHVQYGYFPGMMSKVYSFALYVLPTATMGSENSLTMELFSIYCKDPLSYQTINGNAKPMQSLILAKQTRGEAVKDVFVDIPTHFEDVDIPIRGKKMVTQAMPQADKGTYLATKEMFKNPEGTKGLSQDFSYHLKKDENTNQITAFIKFFDPHQLKETLKNGTQIVTFISKEKMEAVFKIQDSRRLNFYPMLSYSYDEPMPLFEGIPGAKVDNLTGMTTPQIVNGLTGPVLTVNTGINSVLMKDVVKEDWLSQTITITSLIVPDLIPFKDVILIKSALKDGLATKHLISGVKYSLIGSNEMTITAWGMEYTAK